jgi:DNA-binding CsgD family transcriptional regulator/PAS domain-containing protein
MDQSGYNQMLDLVYDAAVDTSLWPSLLGRLADLTGAHSAILIQQNEETGKGQGIRWNVDPAAAPLYYGHFATRNVLHNTHDPRETVRKWTPRLLTDENKIAKSALMRTEYYNDFMRRFDQHSFLMIRLAIIGMDSVTINLIRPSRRPQFDAAEFEIAGRLHPHLIRAFSLGQKLAASRTDMEDLALAFDQSPQSVFLLNAQGQARHLNPAAEALISETGGLRLSGGRLTAFAPDAARTLDALIAAAASPDVDRRRGGSMALHTPGRRAPLAVTVAPVKAERQAIFGGGPAVLVCVSDLDSGAKLPERTVRDLFGLTPAEARVALALFEGASPREAAETLGVSLNTVRVHLARVFEKTGARRQSDLVRLMMRAISAQLN